MKKKIKLDGKYAVLLCIVILLFELAGCAKEMHQNKLVNQTDNLVTKEELQKKEVSQKTIKTEESKSKVSENRLYTTPVIITEKEVITNQTITKVDLDGDKHLEEVSFYAMQQHRDLNTSYLFILEINGVKYQLSQMCAFQEWYRKYDRKTKSYYFDELPEELFYIVDVNRADDTTELAISYDLGDSREETIFYRYENQTVKKICVIPSKLAEDNYQFDGTIHYYEKMLGIVTWYGDVSYKMNGDGIFLPVPNYYDGVVNAVMTSKESERYYTVSMKKALSVYEKPKKSNKVVVLEPQQVILRGTDNQKWVKLETMAGKEYWFLCSMDERGICMLDDMGVSADEIFASLFQIN